MFEEEELGEDYNIVPEKLTLQSLASKALFPYINEWINEKDKVLLRLYCNLGIKMFNFASFSVSEETRIHLM